MIKFYDPSGESYFGQATITRTTSVNGGLSLTGEVFAGDDVLNGLDYGWWLNFDNEKYVITYKKLSDDTNTIVFDAVQQFFWDFAKVALHSQYTGSHEYKFYLEQLFNGSGYTYQNDATVPAFEKENWGYKNKLSLFNDIMDQAGVEFEVHNERVHIAKQIGSDLTSFVRKGINLSNLTEEMKISDFATYAKGYGAFKDSEDQNKGRLEVEYRSELAKQFGDLEMDPVVDERYTIASNLIAELKKQVDATYTVSMNMNIYDLENAGYPNYESPKVGDWILAIDEALNFKRKVRIIKLEEQFDATGKRIGYTATCGDLSIVDQYTNIQSSLDSKVQRIQKSVDDVAVSANGKSKNYYGAKEPISANEGDLWFDQSNSDPDKWSIKQWANGRWEQLTLNPGEVDAKVSVAKQAADIAGQQASAAGSQAVIAGQQASAAGADAKSAGDFAASAASQSTIETAAARSTANSAADAASDAITAAFGAGTTAGQAKSAAASAQSDAADALAEATKSFNDAQNAISNATKAMDAAEQNHTTVTGLVTKVDDIAGTIQTLATTQSVDKLAGTVTTVQNLAQFASDGLKLKADSSTVSTLDSRVTNLSGQLDVQANLISAKVTANDVTGMLNGYATQSWSQGQISAAKNEISASVETVNQRVDNMQVGGRNLYLNSKAIDYSYERNRIPTKITVEPFDSTTNMWHIVAAQGTGTPNGIYFPDYANGKIPDNSDWSYSVDIKGTGKVVNIGIEKGSMNPIIGTVGSEWSRISQTGRVGNPEHKTIVMYFDCTSSPLDVYIKLPKLETGNMPTDWTPAPEDMATQSWTKSLLDVSEGKVSAQVQSVKTDLTNTANALNNNIDTATAGMATETWVNNKVSLTEDGLTADIQKLRTDTTGNIANATEGMATTTWTNTQIDAAKTAINLSVEQSITTSENTLNSNIANATTDMATKTWTKGQLSVTDGNISASVQKLHDAVTGEISTATTDMATQTWTQGKLDLTADGLTSQISSVQNGLDTKYTSLEQTLSGVQATANNAVTQGQLTLLSDQLTSTITGVKNDLSNMQVGGRNLYLNSKALEDNYARNSNALNITVEPFDSTTNMWHFVAEQGVGSVVGIYLSDYAIDKIPDNSDWSFSADMKGIGKVVKFAIENGSMNPIVGTVGSEWSRVSQTGRVGNPEHKTIVMYFNTTDSPLDVYIKLPKLEIGNMPTDWTPAPEDQATVADVSSQITQLQSDINLRVKTGDLISQINVSSEGILIDGRKVYITGDTKIDTGVIKTAMIADAAITNGKIANAAIDNAKIANASINSAKIADLAVGSAQIADGAISSAKIGNAAITSAQIADASILDAKIASLSASKLTAGTIDAANINVIHLNASNITTGTISGANLSINLTTGEILFQRGSIKSTNGNLNIDIDSGNMAVVNSAGDGFRFEDGKLFLATNAWINSFQSEPDYGYIAFQPSFLSNVQGMEIAGTDGIAVTAGNYDAFSFMFQNQPKSGSALALHDNTAFLNAREHTRIEGGSMYTETWPWTNQSRAAIVVGGANGGVNQDRATDQYGKYHMQEPYNVGADIFVKGYNITLQGGHDNSTTGSPQGYQKADLNLGNDGKGYISSTAIYNRTYSSGDHVVITGYGTLGRLTSARKYKIADTPALDVISKAKRVLDIKPAEWYDKAEIESIANAITTGGEPMIDAKIEKHYGFIADDFDAAGLTEVVNYHNGEVDSLSYDHISMYHHVILQNHEKRIAELEAEVKQLKGEI